MSFWTLRSSREGQRRLSRGISRLVGQLQESWRSTGAISILRLLLRFMSESYHGWNSASKFMCKSSDSHCRPIPIIISFAKDTARESSQRVRCRAPLSLQASGIQRLVQSRNSDHLPRPPDILASLPYLCVNKTNASSLKCHILLGIAFPMLSPHNRSPEGHSATSIY